MRTHLHVDLRQQGCSIEDVAPHEVVRAGRHYIAKTLLERGIASVEPLSPENPLIFSVGPLAGTNFSNANRLSIGCRSPLTGGIKESNSGGTFGFAMGQLELAGFTLNDASEDWVVIEITKNKEVRYHKADDYLGKNNFEVANMLHERFGKKN